MIAPVCRDLPFKGPHPMFYPPAKSVSRSVPLVAGDLPLESEPVSAPTPLGHRPAHDLRELLLQDPCGYEGRTAESAVRRAGLDVQIIRCRRDAVTSHASLLRVGACLPIGSAAFVRSCFEVAGLVEPHWSQYPRELAIHMLQQPRRGTASRALNHQESVFVKPQGRAAFMAFVLHKDRTRLDARSRVQFEKLLDLPPATPVWIATALDIASEWRYYVVNGDVVGFSRLHPSDGEGLMPPSVEDISAAIAAIPTDVAYGIDFGVLAGGHTTVLAVRDAWALGLAPHGLNTPKPLDYVKMLWMRWSSIVAESPSSTSNEVRM